MCIRDSFYVWQSDTVNTPTTHLIFYVWQRDTVYILQPVVSFDFFEIQLSEEIQKQAKRLSDKLFHNVSTIDR